MQNLEPNRTLVDLKRTTAGRFKYTLTTEGKQLLIKIYPNTPNKDIHALFGIHKQTLSRFRRELNITKSKDFLKQSSITNIAKGRAKLREIGYTPHFPDYYTKEFLSQRAQRIWRMEKFRVYNGEQQRTKIHLRQPYSNRRAKLRLKLKAMYYIPLTTNNSLSWYYDNSTMRSPFYEERARKVGFTFHPFR